MDSRFRGNDERGAFRGNGEQGTFTGMTNNGDLTNGGDAVAYAPWHVPPTEERWHQQRALSVAPRA
ncbi:hypothetical protein BH11GEM2_BH11GEM2_22600 [soil metagenome]